MNKNCTEVLERDFSFKGLLYNFFCIFYQIPIDFSYRIGYSIDIAYGMDKNMKGK